MGKTQSPPASKGKPEHFKEGVKAKKMKETHPIVAAFQSILMLTCCGVSCGRRGKATRSPTSIPPAVMKTPVEEISIVPESTLNNSVSLCWSSESCCSLPSSLHSRGPQISRDAPSTASSSRPRSCPSRFSLSCMWKRRKTSISPTSDPPGRTQTPVDEISIVSESTLNNSHSLCWSSESCCSLPSSLHSRGPQISRDAPSALSSSRPHCSPSRFSLSCMWKRRKSTISPTSDPPGRTQTPVEEISIVPEATLNTSVSQCPSSMSCCSLPSLHHSRAPQICKDAPSTASSSRPHSCPSRFSVSSMWKRRKSTISPTSDPPGRTQTPVEEISIVPEATLNTSVSQCPSCAT